MKNSNYTELLKDALTSKKRWMRLSYIANTTNVLLVIALLSFGGKEKTIVVPSHFSKIFTIDGDKPSKEYVEQRAHDIFSAILHYNPANVDVQFESILKYVEPQYYQILKTRLDMDANRVKRNSITSSFHITSLKEFKAGEIICEGEQITSIGNVIVSRGIKKYILNYEYRQGKFEITKYKAEGDQDA